jgi:hypothetical protein
MEHLANDAAASRVLMSYVFGDDTIPLGGYCMRALRTLGCEAQIFDCRIAQRQQRMVLRLV